MTWTVPLLALLSFADPAGGPPTQAVAPFLGEEVAAVARVDLTEGDTRDFLGRFLGKLANDEGIRAASGALGAWVGGLRKAGATELFVTVDLADMPGLPVVVVPLPAGADGAAIAAQLTGKNGAFPLAWPAAETVRGAVVAATPAALARVRDAQPVARPDLIEALAAGGDAPVRLAVAPSLTQRRAMEESIPSLPAALGGGPVATLSRGLKWAALTATAKPGPALRVVAQGKDADSAQALQKLLRDGLDYAAKAGQADAGLADLSRSLADLKPEVQGERVTLDADLAKAASLLGVPIARAQEASHRAECVNHLKQIGLAMHNYHSTHNAFPPAFRADKAGKPLLSWRVLILPFMEEQALFNEFHLDEPWDSPHNKALIPRMPKAYACPSGNPAAAAQGKTAYLTPRGAATIFPGATGVKIQEITDGTSNTVLVVETGDDAAVVWTQPEDWPFDPNAPAKGLFGHHPKGTNLGFADGSVKFLRETVAARVWQALFTRNGGEVLGADDF